MKKLGLVIMIGVGSFAFAGASVSRWETTPSELGATSWPVTDPLDRTQWSQAARAGFGYCERRGYASGMMDGNEWAGRYGAICLSATAVQNYSVPYAEFLQAGFSLDAPDINDVHWAVAKRAAQRWCEVKGFLGGFPNGHQYHRHYGVTCLVANSNEVRLSVTQTLLTSTGWYVIAPIANTNWATAARAAQRLCEHLGYLAGWLDGNEFHNRFGLLCVK